MEKKTRTLHSLQFYSLDVEICSEDLFPNNLSLISDLDRA